MHFSSQSVYELARTAVREGCVVALVPAKYEGAPCVYMRYTPINSALALSSLSPDREMRARFALGMCIGSRDLAIKRGFQLDEV